MKAGHQEQAERMSIAEIEAELNVLADAERSDALIYERRNFKAEADSADPQQAEEIRAEQTLYSARKRQRATRRTALEATLAELKSTDVSDKLTNIATAHAEALATAQEALASIDLDALTALENQVKNYLVAEESVREHACQATSMAKNAGVQAPELKSVYSHALGVSYDRFERLKQQISSSSQRVAHDQARLGVNYVAI
ncbi:hypothetical protein ACT3OH_19390 [Vreelandella zhanjiangensis]|uniref:hypothetical protein n=1 Tax=Halomonas hibernica TaxID=2591147 RepID=UPI001555FBFF|nr:hypothetical protein [Halomonas hibernica]